MTLTVVLILFFQIVFAWLVSPLLTGIVQAISQRNIQRVIAPYRELLGSLRSTNQESLIAWAILMVLVLLIPSLGLRAPLDWMADVVFMGAILLFSQLLITTALRGSVLLANVTWLFLLLSAVFLGGSFHNTVLLSNGIVFSGLRMGIALLLAIIVLLLWSRFVVAISDKYDFKAWVGGTSLWLVVLWASALIFPTTLALGWNISALGLAFVFLLVKFIAAMGLFLLATFMHRLLSLRVVLLLQIIVLVVSVGTFSYLVLA